MRTSSNRPTYADLSTPLQQLLLAVYAYFRQNLKLNMSLEDLLRQVRRVVDGMLVADDLTWEKARPERLLAAKRVDTLYKPLRIVVSPTEIKEPQLVVLLDRDGQARQVASTCARFTDLDGETMWTLNVLEQGLIDKLYELRRVGGHVEVLGVPVPVPIFVDRKRPDLSLGKNRNGFFLHLLDIRPSTSTLDFLGASEEERLNAAALLAELAAAGRTPREFILDELENGLHVVGLDTFTMLEDILEFVSLQALSDGRIGQAPGKLHGLIIGPPGQGKKMASLAARVLNPIASELSAAKITVAGLVGSSYVTDEGWESEPGAIPLAAGGVALIQDAHGVDGTTLRRVAVVLQEAMEDGTVRDSSAGGNRRRAATSILMDLNRSSQLAPGGIAPVGAREAGFLRVRPLLSRFDGIFEIPEDAPRAWSVAGEMYKALRPSHGDLDHQPWVRTLKVLVASLRDRHPAVDLDPVRDRMRQVHESIQEANATAIRQIPEASDIPIRMAISFARLVSAAARARNSSVAIDEDVELATKFLNYKLDFVRFAGATSAGGHGEADSTSTDPYTWLKRYCGQEVRTADVRQQYEAETGRGVSERTVRRSLIDLGGKRQTKGTYLLPPRGLSS